MQPSRTLQVLDILGLGYLASVLAAGVAVVWSLFDPSLSFPFTGLGSPLFVLLLFLALRRVLAPNQPLPAPVDWIRRAPVWIWIAGYAVLLTALVLQKHAALESHGSDLGIFTNLLWNLTHGGGWHSGMLERHFLGEHFSPILILIMPLFRVWPASECLLVVQSIALALGAWPIYLLARSRLGHGVALLVMFAYFVYPPLLGVALHDFHEVALAVPLLGFAVWWLSQGRTLPAVLALAAAILCKEELALTAAMIGVTLVLTRRDWKTGVGLFVAGGAVFLVLIGAVIPAFRGEALPFADRYSQFPGGLRGILPMAVQDPVGLFTACWSADKWRYLVDLFRPLGFLSLLSPLECLPALPTLARNLLSNHEPQFSIYFHYPAPMIPFFFAALVVGVGRARDGLRRFVPALSRGESAPLAFWLPLGWLAVAIMLWGASLPRHLERFAPTARMEAFHELAALIPAEASVSAHNRLVPHVAARREVCTFPVIREADYILLDFGTPHFEYPVHGETHRQAFLQALASGHYRLLSIREKFVLLQRQIDGSSAPAPELLDDLFFRYRRENLRKVKGQKEIYWQGSQWYFPPGRWRVFVTLDPRGTDSISEPIVLSVHPYLGGRTGDWSLGDQRIDSSDLSGLEKGSMLNLSWEFEQPRRQMLTLRILNDPTERLRIESLEFVPLDAPGARAALLLPSIPVPLRVP